MNNNDTNLLARAIEKIDGRLRKHENAEPRQAPWIDPTLLNSWTNTGGAYATAGYFHDSNGMTHLRGRITGGAFPSDAFVIPAHFSPSATISFSVPTGAVVDIEADGSVRVISGTSYVALDGISFRTL